MCNLQLNITLNKCLLGWAIRVDNLEVSPKCYATGLHKIGRCQYETNIKSTPTTSFCRKTPPKVKGSDSPVNSAFGSAVSVSFVHQIALKVISVIYLMPSLLLYLWWNSWATCLFKPMQIQAVAFGIHFSNLFCKTICSNYSLSRWKKYLQRLLLDAEFT